MGWKKNLFIASIAAAAGAVLSRLSTPDPADPVPDRPAGYRGSHASKVLHQPGCRFYDTTKLDVAFAKVEDAADAGYRACRLCIGSNDASA